MESTVTHKISSMRPATVRNPHPHRRRPAHLAGPYNPRIQRPTLKHKPPAAVQHCPILKKPPLTNQILSVQHRPLIKKPPTTNKVVGHVQNRPIKKPPPPKQEQIVDAHHFSIKKPPPPKQEQIVDAHHFSIKKPPPPKQEQIVETTPTEQPIEILDEKTQKSIEEVQRIISYKFRRPKLLVEALTHCSHPTDPSYERLEYLGDSVLTSAFTNYLFIANPDYGPGELSSLRAANVSTEKMARVCVKHGFYNFLRGDSARMAKAVGEFTRCVGIEVENEENGDGIAYGGTAKAPKVLADLVESIAAAVYVDCDGDLVVLWQVFEPLMRPIITPEFFNEQPVNVLNEYCQRIGVPLEYKINRKQGNIVEAQIFVGGELIAVGCSDHRRNAKLAAARVAAKKLDIKEPASTDQMSGSAIVVGGKGEPGKGGSKEDLYVFCGKRYWPKPTYKVVRKEGPENNNTYMCAALVDIQGRQGMTLGESKKRVKDAEDSAASEMLKYLHFTFSDNSK